MGLYPTDAMIQFNVACTKARMGGLGRAKNAAIFNPVDESIVPVG